MPAGEGDLAVDIIFQYSVDGVAWLELEDLDELGEPGNPMAPDIDITPLKPLDKFRKFKRGLYNGGDFTFAQFYSKTRMTILQTIRNSEVTYYWQVLLPDAATEANRSKIKWQGQLKSCTIRAVADPDDPLVIVCTGKVNTDPVFTAGT